MRAERESLKNVTEAFFAAFTNVAGPAPVDNLYELCLAQAVIVNATNEVPAVYNLREFVEPRRALLAGASLMEFREYEISGETELHGRIARRRSRYEKTWIENNVRRHGAGTKVLSFVLTPQGWRIASVLWHDDV